MRRPSDRIAIPPREFFNTGLNSATEATMLELFGKPGRKTSECSDPTGNFANRVVLSVDVGPFKVSGLDVAVESLKAVFDDVKEVRPDLFDAVKTEGMLCVRHRRGNPSRFSNHSWGAAIDLFFGADVVPQGTALTERGNLELYFFFHKHGWYWGAGFSGDSVDSMHFEIAEETVRRMAG